MDTKEDAAVIYNVTTHVAHLIAEAWVEWMQQKHIPEVMAKGCFSKYQFTRLLELDETDGMTYTIQFYAESKARYDEYIKLYAPALREDALKSWGKNIVGYRSLMQVIE